MKWCGLTNGTRHHCAGSCKSAGKGRGVDAGVAGDPGARSLDHLPCLPNASPRLMNSCSHFNWMPLSHVSPRREQFLHRGFVSSHLILRLLHVKQPVRARFCTGALWSTDFLRGMTGSVVCERSCVPHSVNEGRDLLEGAAEKAELHARCQTEMSSGTDSGMRIRDASGGLIIRWSGKVRRPEIKRRRSTPLTK